MCGFFFSRNDPNVNLTTILELMKHRGPDSTKIILSENIKCGFNRLSIVNNNTDSDQPMLDSSGRYTLLFNGEIYNYKTIRAKIISDYGINFRTTSDTEVVLNALILYGFQIVDEFDGIFSIVFYDKNTDNIVLIRDHLGVKPLYYSVQNNRLYISSEIKPIAKCIEVEIDANACASFLSFGVSEGESTVFHGVNKVLPGQIVKIDRNSIKEVEKYNRFIYNTLSNVGINKVRTLLEESIALQVPDINYGIMFSGGLDSSLLLALTHQNHGFSGTFSINVDHKEMSEKVHQKSVLDKLHLTSKSNIIENGIKDFSLDSLSRVASRYDLPIVHPNYIGSFLLAERASKKGIKVLLSGEGADEVFFGYRWFLDDSEDYLQYVKHDDIKSLILGFDDTKAIDFSNLRIEEKFQQIYIQKWLTRQDLAGMANSVEIRVPFLSSKLVRFVNKIKSHEKLKNNTEKFYLKKISELYFENDFIYRKKVGFDYPLNEWITQEHYDFLLNHHELFNIKRLKELWNNRRATYYASRCLFILVMYALWMENLKQGENNYE
jgi:asparagine synthase (glutamine-hydrolysing)